MAKRSQKRISRKGRDQAGCVWGFISMFDFRTGGQATKRLLSDKRRMSVQAIVAAHSNYQNIHPDFHENTENISDCEESNVLMIDTVKSSVKELIEEEMFNDQGPTYMSNVSEMGLDQIDLKQDDSKVSAQKSLDILDLQTIVEDLAQVYHDDNNPGAVVDENLVVAIKHYIEERSRSNKSLEEEGKSKDLKDVLRTLSTNKSSFLNLLQDPNSRLVQHIHSLDDSCLKKDLSQGSSSSEGKSVDKHRSFFRRRSKSMEINPFGMGKDSQQSSSKIFILKPGPTLAKPPETDVSRNASSQFSFMEIKRKLRHAMGKERPGISRDGLSSKPQNGDSLGWNSPNRNHFYTERFATLKKSEEVVTRLKDTNLGAVNENLKPGVSDIYIEAKRQISKILNNGENSESTTGGNKSLGRVLSFSDYNSSSCCSPRDHGNEIFVADQVRLSPRGAGKNNNGSEILQQKNLESNSNETAVASEQKCSLDENSSSEIVDTDEIEESKLQEEEKLIDICSEADSDNTISPDVQNGDTAEIKNEDMTESDLHEQQKMTSSFCPEDDSYSIVEDHREVNKEDITLEEGLFGDDQTFHPREMSPSCSSVCKDVGDSESVIDKMERPSPISVLEPLFTDDDISPARTISQSVGKDIQPRHIHFEKQSDEETCIRISDEDEESAFEYIEAVLLGSGLNWDEFLLRWHSLYEILEPSLFDEVELFSSRARHNQKLLFDFANDALKEICDNSFGGFSEVSKKNMKAAPKGMDLINEVWDRINLHLCRDPHTLSLDHLVKTDMSKHGKWMKLQSSIEVIGFEIGEYIFDELIEDTLGFLDYYSISETAVECGEV